MGEPLRVKIPDLSSPYSMRIGSCQPDNRANLLMLEFKELIWGYRHDYQKKLHASILQSVKISMLNEGYKTDRPQEIMEKARQLMKRHHDEVSIPRK